MFREVRLFRCHHSKHKFLTEDREVVMVMDMLKWTEFILGGILCQGEELVKRENRNENVGQAIERTSESANWHLTYFRLGL